MLRAASTISISFCSRISSSRSSLFNLMMAMGSIKKGGAGGRLVVDHAMEAALIFGLYGQAVAAVPHGDHRILEHGAAGIQDGVQLGMDPVAGDLHLAAYMAQSRAGIVGHLFFGNDAAGDLVVYVGQWLQARNISSRESSGSSDSWRRP
mgnify:CR=1 FL=1